MLIKLILASALICLVLAILSTEINPIVKRHKTQRNTLSRPDLKPSCDSFCELPVQFLKTSYRIKPTDSLDHIRYRKLVDPVRNSVDSPKSNSVKISHWINNPRRVLRNIHSITSFRYKNDRLRFPLIAKNTLTHKSKQNQTNKLERRNPAVLLNPLLLPLRILLALYRLLTLPLRILLAPVFLLLRAILRFLILLVQLLNPFFYLVLLFQGAQFVFNIARIIAMILRQIFRRREDYKDEKEEIEVITILDELKPKKKHHRRSSLVESNASFEKGGEQLRSMVESLRQLKLISDTRSCRIFKRYITENRVYKQTIGPETGMGIFLDLICLDSKNQTNILLDTSDDSSSNRYRRVGYQTQSSLEMSIPTISPMINSI